MNKNARRCVFFVQSVKYEKLDFALWCKNVYLIAFDEVERKPNFGL